MARCAYGRGWRLVWAAAILVMATCVGAGAATLDGVTLPDRLDLGGTELRLNGIALRTYSWLGAHIYVAGLYLEHPSHDAEAILDSPEKKVLIVSFVHDVDATNARKAWRNGFRNNCLPPCRLAPGDVERFLSGVPAMRAGDRFSLAFAAGRVEVTMNGRPIGVIADPGFARAILLSFIGPVPPTPRVKRELLGVAG